MATKIGRVRLQILIVFLILLAASVVPARAQTGSAIAGVVRDTSGGVLPGVTVEARAPR